MPDGDYLEFSSALADFENERARASGSTPNLSIEECT